MLIGYVRVSTNEQTLDLQIDALTKAGCEEIRQDKISSVAADRPGLKATLDIVRAGDTLAVWRLDRVGRSLKQLIELINELQDRRVGFKSVTESIDTTTTGGKLVFHIFGALAEFERNLIKERTNAGLEAARVRGRKGGRPRAISDPKKLNRIYSMYDDKDQYTIGDILGTFHISRATLYKYLGKREIASKKGGRLNNAKPRNFIAMWPSTNVPALDSTSKLALPTLPLEDLLGVTTIPTLDAR